MSGKTKDGPLVRFAREYAKAVRRWTATHDAMMVEEMRKIRERIERAAREEGR